MADRSNKKKPRKALRRRTDVASHIGTRSVSSKRDLELLDEALPDHLFVLPVNNAIVFPTMVAPINVSEKKFIRTVEEAVKRGRWLAILLTTDGPATRETEEQELYHLGVAVKVVKRLKMPDGSINILVHAIKRFRVKKFLSEAPHFVAQCQYLEDVTEKSKEMDALSRTVISDVKKLSDTNPFFTEEMKLAILNAPGPGVVADLVAFALSLPKDEAQEYLEILSVKERFQRLLVHLRREQDVADLQKKIQDDVNNKINSMQREFFLKEQLKAIKKELGYEEDDQTKSSKTFREKIEAAQMPKETKKAVLEELSKFETLSEQSPEYNVTRTYLETVCSLPWNEYTKDHLDIHHAEKVLDQDHFGLEKVKSRIVEFLAVRALGVMREKKTKTQTEDSSQKGSIICLVGPPGVGKTSIGKSVARALGRKFYRFSLGGMRDEAEIKGHRRTYIGAMPGKIIQALKRVGTKNPILMLDEIDKLGQSYQGDPASALLEVLDPEQNGAFLDHYLDVPFDLSKVLFIATANSVSTIPAPLMDRMEVIEIPGYTLEEKEKIAKQYVIPKVFKEHGLKNADVKISTQTLKSLMLDYAREPGMRTVQQMVARIARKAATKILKSKRKKKALSIAPKNLKEWLGPKRYYNEMAERITHPGVIVGLAWTASGGDILFIEASDIPGTGQLKLTGQMGDVMLESANIAWSYVKKKLADEFGYKDEDFKKKDIHLHIPAGAIPKDGPSAGVTMATALLSLFSGKVSKQKIAMTGELSLTGKVLPVGGIKEKILAAKRAGVKTVLLPKQNEKDLEDIPKYATQGMKIQFVERVEEVFKIVLGPIKKTKSNPS